MLLQVVAVEQNGKQCHEVPEHGQNIRSLSELVNAYECRNRSSTSIVWNGAASFSAMRLYLPLISFICLTVAEYCELIDELYNEYQIREQNGKAPIVLLTDISLKRHFQSLSLSLPCVDEVSPARRRGT